MPIWPKPWVGSISHKDGSAVACVADSREFSSLGIDIEDPSAMTDGVAKHVSLPEELQLFTGLTLEQKLLQQTLLFSAKEALFKYCYPVCSIFFGFQDALLSNIDVTAQTFSLTLLRDLPPSFKAGQKFPGRFSMLSTSKGPLLLTLIS
jgi:enterobactin synthetase component D